jgi:hypothetical protein
MPPRTFDHHDVAVDDGTTLEQPSLDEVVDEIVFVQGVLIVALSGMAERGRPGVMAGPPSGLAHPPIAHPAKIVLQYGWMV